MCKIYSDLIREYKIEKCKLKISKEMEEIIPIKSFNNNLINDTMIWKLLALSITSGIYVVL